MLTEVTTRQRQFSVTEHLNATQRVGSVLHKQAYISASKAASIVSSSHTCLYEDYTRKGAVPEPDATRICSKLAPPAMCGLFYALVESLRRRLQTSHCGGCG